MLQQSEIRDRLAEKLQITKAQADAFMKANAEILTEDLIATGKTKVLGFGTLEVRYRAAREGVNPQTKEKIQIPETLAVGLSVGKAIKDKVNAEVDINKYKPQA